MVKRIGLVANCKKPQAPAVLAEIVRAAADLGIELRAAAETARLAPGAAVFPEHELAANVDVLLALGGDGTVIRAVRALRGCDTPLAGVNLGSLGFMTNVPQHDAVRLVKVLAEGDYKIAERSMLSCRVFREDGPDLEAQALNDVVLGWGADSRVVTLKLSIDGEDVTSYACDGLILSTPTGSTGHALSSGGPIVHPETAAFVIGVICAHTLTTRPLVIPDACTLDVLIERSAKKLLLSIDGQEEESVGQGTRLRVVRSPQRARFIHLPDYSYYSVLRQKLHWGGSAL